MKDFGFFRVAAVSPRVKVGDVSFNVEQTCNFIDKAEEQACSLVVFPELGLTGYTCADLFSQTLLLDAAQEGTERVKLYSRGKRVTAVVGVPVSFCGRLYNCAAVIRNGSILGLVPKIHIPSYGEFYENRWFSSGADFLFEANLATGSVLDNGKALTCRGLHGAIDFAGSKTNICPNQLFKIGKATFAVELCEDLWTPIPPSSYYALAGAEILVNLSASNEVVQKHPYRKALVANQSARTISAYVYSSAGYGESTQDLAFAGSSLIYEFGTRLAENERFSSEGSMISADVDIEKLQTLRLKSNTFSSVTPDGTGSCEYAGRYFLHELGPAARTDFSKELRRSVDPRPFVPMGDAGELAARSKEILSIQVLGLATRLEHVGCKSAVLGISGGLDSTLALLVTALAFDKLLWDRKRIIGVTMPGFGTSGRTHSNALALMDALGVSSKEISIVPAVSQHFTDIGQDASTHDVTYENCQARERTQILMDIANKEDGIVVGTGDLSELALGWATYNGDHMSMYAVNAGIPKTLVRHLVKWTANSHFAGPSSSGRSARDILEDIVDTPISPELIPADESGNISQKTEDLVGPYELHDFFLYNMFRFGYAPEKLLFLAKKAFRPEEYSEQEISKWLKTFCRRFFSQQYKRSCLPDGPKVGTVALSPRGDLRMPSDFCRKLWDDNTVF